MKLRTVFPCFGQQARFLPRLKCAVLSLHESVAVEMVCLKKHLLFCCSKRGNVLQQRFSLFVLLVLPLVALPSFAL